mmetsp:Transcript_60167/g.130487  ORF Transcript_60167/g.130487 Transcript_60167/m.130487 type:complete len:153 (-) Transcript_60167:92-550(-)
MPGDTIEIRNCASSVNRVALKAQMEQFGEVSVCHMGNRSNPDEEPAKVRFPNPSHAEAALTAIQAGKIYLDGVQLQAEWWSGKKAPRPAPGRDSGSRRDLEVTSRDLFLQERESRKGRERDKRSRSRSRKRRRSRSGSRSRSRSKDRRRRRD